jgi:glycosyltransferase involved in cell wall biosynthesis
MKILFVHQNFPSQYFHLAPELARRGHEVVSLSMKPHGPIRGVRSYQYQVPKAPHPETHLYAMQLAYDVIRAEAAARSLLEIKQGGFTPDVICIHPGWGEGLFLREVFPGAKQLHYVEYYYHSGKNDMDFDVAENGPSTFEDRCFAITKNATNLLSFEQMDWGVTPTRFQKDTLSAAYTERVSVIHDGIDTQWAIPSQEVHLHLDRGDVNLTTRDEVVTFVNRNLEPYRGFHIFMRALPEILRRRPKAHVIMVGGEGVSYGRPSPDGRSFKQKMVEEVGREIDTSRVHAIGQIPHSDLLALFQVSSAHVYLTYPFVLSWSMLEAMSAECLVIGSRTPPVEEVITDGVNGLLVDFFDVEGLANAVVDALAHKRNYVPLRKQARRHIREHYDLREVCLPRQVALVEQFATF